MKLSEVVSSAFEKVIHRPYSDEIREVIKEDVIKNINMSLGFDAIEDVIISWDRDLRILKLDDIVFKEINNG